jgi:hypothetical protein
MASLIASQSTGYAVPAGAGDVSFTASKSLGAFAWSSLNETQLGDWANIWNLAKDDANCPIQTYTETSGASVDLFQLSPRAGFCVAFALREGGTLNDPGISACLLSL